MFEMSRETLMKMSEYYENQKTVYESQPFTAYCRNCMSTCTGSCTGGCKGSCDSSCSGSCMTSCKSGCSVRCTARCAYSNR